MDKECKICGVIMGNRGEKCGECHLKEVNQYMLRTLKLIQSHINQHRHLFRLMDVENGNPIAVSRAVHFIEQIGTYTGLINNAIEKAK